MNYEQIKLQILGVLQKCEVSSFPIDCFHILDMLGIPCRKYSEQTKAKQESCFMVSDDAFTLMNIIYYNDTGIPGRIRFSLMHELGHIVLEHQKIPTEEMEQEANYFSSHLLAPRIVIHHSNCKNEQDVAARFSLTNESARYAFQDYTRWRRYTIYHQMTCSDKAIFIHFYDESLKCFIYHRNYCSLCGSQILNSIDQLCSECNKMSYLRKSENSKQNALAFLPIFEDL